MSFPSSNARQAAEPGSSAASLSSRFSRAGSASFNALVACIIVAVLASAGLTYGIRVVRVTREVALRYELANIRTAILLFAALNRRFPADLQELVAGRYLLPDAEYSIAAGPITVESRTVFTRSYLEPESMDVEGRILDPFGMPYRYNPQSGRVSAAAERYRQW